MKMLFRNFSPLRLFSWLRSNGYWFRPGDIGLFLQGAKTDARIGRLKSESGERNAFETLYSESADPWVSNDSRYEYQRRKYEIVEKLIPDDRRYRYALDMGCGLGLLSRGLANKAEKVLGLDLAQSAIDRAITINADRSTIAFRQADILDLPDDLNGQFDLVVIADALYYLSKSDEGLMKTLALRFQKLLTSNGRLVLVNHYFMAWDGDSRLTNQIHQDFENSPAWRVIAKHWRPFYRMLVLEANAAPIAEAVRGV